MIKVRLIIGIISCFGLSYADQVIIPMYLTNPAHTLVGTVSAVDTKYGVMFTPQLTNLAPDLSPGVHGFHIHENPTCESAGMAAGGHLDPDKTRHHYGPYSNGHLGDLPALYINSNGSVITPVVAPRIKVADLLGHSLMIHNGGDNYSDKPALGGGGPRMVCGVVPIVIAKNQESK